MELRKKINKAKSEGVDVISLAIGDPVEATPSSIIDELCRSARDPQNHRYPTDEEKGMLAFRKEVARWYLERYGVTLNPENEILGLIGSKEGCHHFVLARVNPGDTVPMTDQALQEGGLFGYRFQFPAMRVGRFEIYWHRPLVAYRCPKTSQPEVIFDAPLGYLTAYHAKQPDLDKPLEAMACPLARELYISAFQNFTAIENHHQHRITIQNIRKLLDAWELLGDACLPRSFARALLTAPKEETLDDWLGHLEISANNQAQGKRLTQELRKRIEPESAPLAKKPASRLSESLTYHRTARRSFETAYWRTIARLAHGKYINKDNADCVRDPVTPVSLAASSSRPGGPGRLSAGLLSAADREGRHGRQGRHRRSALPLADRFRLPLVRRLAQQSAGKTEERDLVVVIPGRDRRRAVIMADHYDTAYMEDRLRKARGGSGARLAAAGADDNHSATAALMLAAPIFLELSRAGKLGCDVWLVHLTGEEFPSDCMGARHPGPGVVEGTLKLRRHGSRRSICRSRRSKGSTCST